MEVELVIGTIRKGIKSTGCPIIYDTIKNCNNFTYLQQIIFINVLNCCWLIEIYVKILIIRKCIIWRHLLYIS